MPQIAISASASGDTVLVSPAANRKVKVTSYTLVAAAGVVVKFTDETGDLTGAMPMSSNGSIVGGYNPEGHFVTRLGEDLEINLSLAVAVAGHMTYEEIP